MGTGKTDVDCFSLTHASEEVRMMTLNRHAVQLKKSNKDKK